MINRQFHGWRPALHAFVCILLLCAGITESKANDIQITNQTIHPHSGGYGEVEFDLTWQNSWRVATEPNNWDAAWVFCKIRRNGGDWTHLTLDTTGHTIPSTPQLITTSLGLVDTDSVHNSTTNPVAGIFLYRTNDGFGTFTANDVRLRWNYSDNGASSGDTIDIRVYAIEMVYIPEGAFYAGDTVSALSFRQKETTDDSAWHITSEGAIATTTGDTGNYYYPGAGDASGFTIPAEFPKGYAHFYVMKGEISQSQWVGFFNTLTSTQKSDRDVTTSHGTYGGKNNDNLVGRNNVSWVTGDALLPDRGAGATYTGVAMGYLAWADLSAILDWSGLRPMSDLEFEKAGRGPRAPVAGEYAWGSTSLTRTTSITDSGLTSERGQLGSNANTLGSPSVGGPLRVGSFAKGVSDRVSAGASFYGALDLSGNVWERTVTVGNSTGRDFQRRYHGDGVLDSSGNSNVTDWPGNDSEGTGYRGGAYNMGSAALSHRSSAAATLQIRVANTGGRGVRTAP